MKKDKSVYVRHIHDCIARITEYVRDGKEAFFRDRETASRSRGAPAHAASGLRGRQIEMTVTICSRPAKSAAFRV